MTADFILFVAAGAFAGGFVVTIFKRLSDTQFQTLLIGLIFLSGIGIIVRDFLLP